VTVTVTVTVTAARLRAGVFTTTGLLLSTSAHVIGEGDVPTLAPIAAVAALSLLTVGILGRTRRGPLAVSVAMISLQVSAHIAMAGHHHMSLPVPPWPMLLAHAATAAGLGCWLSGIDRALVQRLRGVLAPLVAPVLPVFGVVRGAVPHLISSVPLGVVPGRGPPRAG
jgi:hypothetical protein